MRVRQGSTRIGKSVAPWLADCEEHHQATISWGRNAVVPVRAKLDSKNHYRSTLLADIAHFRGFDVALNVFVQQ